MKFEINHRWLAKVVFTAEIAALEDAPVSVKLGLAVKAAITAKADLRCADLRGADLRGADLRGAVLRSADLRGADLSGADLRGAVLRGADLSSAVLRGADLSSAVLRGADLRGADWIPKITGIHGKIYDAASANGALDMDAWHKDGDYCGTTHCRAGWVCVLAGDGGRVLEGVYGTAAAAALIYQASDPTLDRIPNWYATKDDALADMKRLANAEVAI